MCQNKLREKYKGEDRDGGAPRVATAIDSKVLVWSYATVFARM